MSELDKTNPGYDEECHQLLLHIRTVLMKTRGLSEEEMRQWESSGEADADFVAKKRISQDSQLALAQGWTDRGQRKAHGGKKSRKKRKRKRKSKKYKLFMFCSFLFLFIFIFTCSSSTRSRYNKF